MCMNSTLTEANMKGSKMNGSAVAEEEGGLGGTALNPFLISEGPISSGLVCRISLVVLL